MIAMLKTIRYKIWATISCKGWPNEEEGYYVLRGNLIMLNLCKNE